MKKHRRLIQIEGTFIRLLSPFRHNEAGWIVVSKDRGEAVALYFQRLNKVNGSWVRFKLAGLDPARLYTVSYEVCREKKSYRAYGDELMNVGIPVDRIDLYREGGDFAAILYEIEG
jgi:alpha-galactosidase